jgi:hypothetical protein
MHERSESDPQPTHVVRYTEGNDDRARFQPAFVTGQSSRRQCVRKRVDARRGMRGTPLEAPPVSRAERHALLGRTRTIGGMKGGARDR